MGEFTDAEMRAMRSDPDVLRAVADWNESQACMAEAMDYSESSNYHLGRAAALRIAAGEIEADY